MERSLAVGSARPRRRAARMTRMRALCGAVVVVSAAAAGTASATDFALDSATTYCWKVGASIYTSAVSSASISSSSGDGCALALALDFPTTAVYAYDTVAVAWNATLRLDSSSSSSSAFLSNTFDIDQLYVGLDRISQRYYQIVHSRIHTCEYGASDCSPVGSSSQGADNTSNLVANFSDGFAAFSSSDLIFNQPGNYTLLAHLILPGEDPTSERYDYAVFTKVEILSPSTETTTTQPYTESSTSSAADNAGMSTQVICVIIISGIVAVAMFAIGVTTLRSNKKHEQAVNDKAPKRRGMPFERRTGLDLPPTPIAFADNTADENEFAMLSVHEATMSRPRNGGGGTFLTALGRRSSQHAQAGTAPRASPIAFVGPTCRQSIKRKPGYGGAGVEVGGYDADDYPTPANAISETPTSGRANYSDMDPTPRPQQLAGRPSRPSMAARPSRANMAYRPSKIIFNDIHEDDDDVSEGRPVPAASDLHLGATAVDLDLTRVSKRIKHAISEDEDVSWRQNPKLTADDLRETEIKGPSLQLSDLGLMRGAMRDSDFD